MKQVFVLDENVLRAALKCSSTANKLLLLISRNCHCVAVNSWLHDCYWKTLRMYKTSVHHPYVQPVLGDILRDDQKCIFLTGPFEDERKISVRHRKDVFLAQIALATNSRALIVSTDQKTKTDLARMGLKALTLKAAVAYAM